MYDLIVPWCRSTNCAKASSSPDVAWATRSLSLISIGLHHHSTCAALRVWGCRCCHSMITLPRCVPHPVSASRVDGRVYSPPTSVDGMGMILLTCHPNERG